MGQGRRRGRFCILLTLVMCAAAGACLLQHSAPAQMPSGASPSNAVFIEEVTGAEQVGRPFTISRVFAQGEIANFARAVVNGNAVLTQCDVKTRWPDGSVQHALVSFAANLGPKQRLTVEFTDQETGNNEGYLSKDEMLNFLNGRWGAGITAGNDVGGSYSPRWVNSRDILFFWDGNESELGVRYWLKGPVVTQVIVEDKEKMEYDFGWRNPLRSVGLAGDIDSKASSIRVPQGDVAEIQRWKAPLTVVMNAERIRVCTIEYDSLKVCAGGRGADGTVAANHPTFLQRIVPDQGWEEPPSERFRSLHPVFVLTFYAGWPGVKLETILENMWTERLQDQIYNARLYREDPPVPYTPERRLHHYARSRWRVITWSGQEPGEVRVDLGLPYMVHSKVLPNFDLSLSVPDSAVAAEEKEFLASDQGATFGSGQYLRYFPAVGGRPDIGLFPRWYVRYLYTFDPRLYKVMYLNGNVSGHVPIHYRESESGRPFLKASQVDAKGRVVSLDSRPTFVSSSPEWFYGVTPEDGIRYAGSVTNNSWDVDDSHQPGMVFIPYLVTGDWYFLEELYMWSSYNLQTGNPQVCEYCRGGSAGYIFSQPRGEAWALRTVAHAAFMAPDGSPEKVLFTEALDRNIAVREGILDIRDGAFYEPAPGCAAPCAAVSWRYGRDLVARNRGPNPLYFLERDGVTSNVSGIDAAKTSAVTSPWMTNFIHLVFGHIEELGFTQIGPLRRAAARNLLHQILDPDFNPWLVDSYRMPLKKRAEGNPYMSTWAEVKDGYTASEQARSSLNRGNVTDLEHGYANIARAAASYLPGISDGALSGSDAWDWIEAAMGNRQSLGWNPKWAIRPRVEAVPPEGN